MVDEFEVRLSVVRHMARMLLEMASIDFDNLSEDEEALLLEDYEDVATHLLDSLSFSPEKSEDGVHFGASFAIQDPEEYIKKMLEDEGLSSP
jgi:hypothetical protein